VTIAGADVGGFEPAHDGELWADPELMIRWYCAYSLLPWFRNHYSGKEGKKLFQEPYAYAELQNTPYWKFVPEKDRNMYDSVLPICRYVIQLRYSLLQLLYDAMFEDMINGLPIARAMIITDPLDSSLYQTNEWYTRGQYLVRNDLLVAPALYKESQRKTRRLYLPAPDDWYPMNLRPGTKLYLDGILAQPLAPKVNGGNYVDFDCHISPDEKRLPYVTPMYIREGGIIPQMAVQDWVPDRTRDDKDAPPNPLSINIYPGKDNSYDMYLDDGVSRESAPCNIYLSALPNNTEGQVVTKLANAHGDREANSIFRNVRFQQTTTREFSSDQMRDIRRIRVSTPFSQYGDDLVQESIGSEYRIVVWHASRWPAMEMDLDAVNVKSEGNVQIHWETDKALRATVAWVPVSATVDVTLYVSHPA
jgi:alpha-glucosidase (family GH31 glycosyl hydrolase)